MNERILELRTQAAAWVAKNHQPQDPNAYSQKEIDQRYLMYEEKFAELIVRECISKCEFVADMATITNKGEMARKTKATADSCAKMIKEHFGVDE